MKQIITCTVFIVLWGTFAFSQNQTSKDEYHKYEVFAGYSENSLLDPSRIENSDSPDGIKAFSGLNVSATYNFKRFIGLKADFSGHYKDYSVKIVSPIITTGRIKSNIYNFFGGIQIKDNKKSKRFSPFAHALVGISASKVTVQSSACPLLPMCKESNSGLSLAVGGGVDLRIKKKFSIRLIQIDYNPAFFKTKENRLRAGFGIVFH